MKALAVHVLQVGKRGEWQALSSQKQRRGPTPPLGWCRQCHQDVQTLPHPASTDMEHAL